MTGTGSQVDGGQEACGRRQPAGGPGGPVGNAVKCEGRRALLRVSHRLSPKPGNQGRQPSRTGEDGRPSSVDRKCTFLFCSSSEAPGEAPTMSGPGAPLLQKRPPTHAQR